MRAFNTRNRFKPSSTQRSDAEKYRRLQTTAAARELRTLPAAQSIAL